MASKTKISRTMAFKSIASEAFRACLLIMSDMEANNFSEEDIFAVHLAIEEAFINAVKHGNDGDSDKEIKMEYSVSPESIEILLSDQGDGFDPEAIPDPRCGDNIYKTGGRGLFLIRSYMDVVEFNKPGNQIHMIKRRDKEKEGK